MKVNLAIEDNQLEVTMYDESSNPNRVTIDGQYTIAGKLLVNGEHYYSQKWMRSIQFANPKLLLIDNLLTNEFPTDRYPMQQGVYLAILLKKVFFALNTKHIDLIDEVNVVSSYDSKSALYRAVQFALEINQIKVWNWIGLTSAIPAYLVWKNLSEELDFLHISDNYSIIRSKGSIFQFPQKIATSLKNSIKDVVEDTISIPQSGGNALDRVLLAEFIDGIVNDTLDINNQEVYNIIINNRLNTLRLDMSETLKYLENDFRQWLLSIPIENPLYITGNLSTRRLIKEWIETCSATLDPIWDPLNEAKAKGGLLVSRSEDGRLQPHYLELMGSIVIDNEVV